jgi:hypothetical protein
VFFGGSGSPFVFPVYNLVLVMVPIGFPRVWLGGGLAGCIRVVWFCCGCIWIEGIRRMACWRASQIRFVFCLEFFWGQYCNISWVLDLGESSDGI